MQKTIKLCACLMMVTSLTACVPVIVGAGAAAGGYALARNQGTVGKYTNDAVITSKIKTKFLGNIHLKSRNISVVTEGGNVVLTGTVATQAMRNEAIRIAQYTQGVRSVNVVNLRVVP